MFKLLLVPKTSDDVHAEETGWVSPDDALLAIDLNGNGTIDDISEVFGSDTQAGLEELAAYDQMEL